MKWIPPFLVLAAAAALSPLACSSQSSCEDGEFRCTGTALEQCHDGEFHVHEDCADKGQMCHAEMGHCMATMAASGSGGGGGTSAASGGNGGSTGVGGSG